MNGRPISEDELHLFVDRVLDDARRQEVEAYLAQHADVAQRIEAYARQRAALRQSLAPVAEEPVPAELDLGRMIAQYRSRRTHWWQAAAALLLFVGGGGAGWMLRDAVPVRPQGMAALADEATDSFRVFAPDRAHPVEFHAADRGALVEWATRQLKAQVSVPDLAASGYHFMGGRLVATGHGPAVLFMYDNDHGSRLVMLSRPMAVDRNMPMVAHTTGQIAGYYWADDGMGYSLVGDIPPDALHPIAAAVQRQTAGRA